MSSPVHTRSCASKCRVDLQASVPIQELLLQGSKTLGNTDTVSKVCSHITHSTLGSPAVMMTSLTVGSTALIVSHRFAGSFCDVLLTAGVLLGHTFQVCQAVAHSCTQFYLVCT